MYKLQPTMDDRLLQLAREVQKHPPIQQRHQVLWQLITEILKSNELCRPHRGKIDPNRYEEVYEQAIHDLTIYLYQNIGKYKPELATVMGWVNYLLKKRFFIEAIPKVIGKPEIKKMSLDDLDNQQYLEEKVIERKLEEEKPFLLEIIKQCIEEDREDIFKNEYIGKPPKANFQQVAMRRLAGKAWKEIAAEFDLTVSTASGFYYRCIEQFAERVKEYCRNQGS